MAQNQDNETRAKGMYSISKASQSHLKVLETCSHVLFLFSSQAQKDLAEVILWLGASRHMAQRKI